jgi:hypothetical protein
LLTQLPGQAPVEFFPEHKAEFFAKVVDSQITFRDEEGAAATGLVIHPHGKDYPAGRVDEGLAKDRATELADRIRNQTPAAQSASELRRHIAQMQAGAPDYNRMAPELADAVRGSVTRVQLLLRSLGALQSLQFKSVGKDGTDNYEAQFEHGTVQWRIGLTPDGKIGHVLISRAAVNYRGDS